MPKPTIRTEMKCEFSYHDIRDLLIRESGMPPSSTLDVLFDPDGPEADLKLRLVHVNGPNPA